MLSIAKRETAEGLFVAISGSFEESVQLDSLIGEVKNALVVNCKAVTHINSVGVKNWINYFLKLKTDGVKVKFEECSPSIVEQINLISNFCAGGEVVSILIPYACTRCRKDFVIPCETKKIDIAALPQAKCERADCAVQFDDVIEEYFYFLKN